MALAQNERCLQAFRAGALTWAIQFHAEVTAESVLYWLHAYNPHEDGRLDVDRLTAETEERIGEWNAFGRDLCGRFLAVAEDASAAGRGATTRATSPRS